MSELKIRKLPEAITKRGMIYKLISRTEKFAIYSQHDANDELLNYEVYKVRLSKPHPEGCDVQKYDVVELFPSDEAFGHYAWTYRTLKEAQAKYEKLQCSTCNIEEKNRATEIAQNATI